MSKTSIKERNKAIRLAWEKEQGLVSEGKGTRDWTEAQQKDILDPDKGKAYDDNGRAFEGQHMKSAAEYPEYQGDPDNIQFLTRDEHLEAHKGSWQNPTNWYYNPETKEFVDFGENKPTPCEIIQLSDPISIQIPSPVAEKDDVESTREKQAASETSGKPDSIPPKNETRETATPAAAKERVIPRENRSFGDKLLGVVGLHATISDRKLRRPPGRKLLAYRIDREPLPPCQPAWRPLPVNPRSNFLQAPTHNRR